jgi:S1-C subfamily serine protease
VATLLDATGRDIYGDPGADRAVLELAASLQRGDSGAPFVTADGSVLGVVFAVAADRDGVSYALAPSEVAVVLDGPLHPVDTGPCLV